MNMTLTKSTTDLSKAVMYAHNKDDAFCVYDFYTELNYSEEFAREVLQELEQRNVIHRAGEDRWRYNERADLNDLLQTDEMKSREPASLPTVEPSKPKQQPVSVPLKVLQLDNGNQLEVAQKELKVGIKRTEGFEKKKLAKYAINTGLKCGVGCFYCSTGAMVRTHAVFQEIGRTSFEDGYAVVDPTIVDRVKKDAKAIKLEQRGTIEISTIVDAWAPEAMEYMLGRKCMEAVLSEPGWTVRLLSKRKEMAECFDLVAKCPERVLVGMSITAMPDMEHLVSIVEPNAASISERMELMREASKRGFRVYGMICPLLPAIGARPEQVAGMIQFCEEIGVEEIFVENLNARGRSVVACEEVLRAAGHLEQADALAAIRVNEGFAEYVLQLVQTTQAAMREHSDIKKLRFLLYTKSLPQEILTQIRQDPEGIVFLDDERVDDDDAKKMPETAPVTAWKSQTPQSIVMPLRDITVDFDLQCRDKPDEERVREYAEEMERGAQFPPLVVFTDGTHHWLADGFHRYWAAQLAGRREIEVQVYDGGKAQTIAYAAGANVQHGIRRTTADKQLAVKKLFVDVGLGNRSDTVIADMVGVDHKTVGSMRKKLTASGEIPHYEERICKDGRTVQVAPPPQPEPEADSNIRLPVDSTLNEPKKESSVDMGVLLPKYPTGLVAGLESMQKILSSVEGFSTISENMVGFGYSRGQVSELPGKLRALADTIEAVSVDRPEEVPISEMRWVMMWRLEQFLLVRRWAKSFELVECPSKNENGEWVANIVLKGKPKLFTYVEKSRLWI